MIIFGTYEYSCSKILEDKSLQRVRGDNSVLAMMIFGTIEWAHLLCGLDCSITIIC
jgi:hypothetical protein